MRSAAGIIAMLREHGAAAIEAGRLQAHKEAEIIARYARSFAPEDERDLIKSIRVESVSTISTRGGDKDFIGAVVKAGDETTIVTNSRGTRFQNAKLQETGTRDMPANPYFNPAKRLRRRAAKTNIARAMRKAWKAGR